MMCTIFRDVEKKKSRWTAFAIETNATPKVGRQQLLGKQDTKKGLVQTSFCKVSRTMIPNHHVNLNEPVR